MRSTLRSADLVRDDSARLLRADGFVARVRPWPGDPVAVHLVTVDSISGPSPAALARWLSDLVDEGVRVVRTGALGPSSQSTYLDAGFGERQELALLSHPLGSIPKDRPDRAGSGHRRPAAHDLVALAMIDRRAFGGLWGLDLSGIVDACRATPKHRLRVARNGSATPAGFAISGRSGHSAYLQRLAVDPSAQRRGIGRSLVIDSLRWAKRHRATSVLVNTHVDNEPALQLYEALGFVEMSYRLAVLERKLP